MKKLFIILFLVTLSCGNLYSQAKKSPAKKTQSSAAAKQQAQTKAPEIIDWNGKGEFSRVVNVKGTPKQLFQYSKSFFSTKIRNFQRALQFEDASTYKLQLNSSYSFETPGQVLKSTVHHLEVNEDFNLTLDCKQGKFRISIENPRFDYRVVADDGHGYRGDLNTGNEWIIILAFSKDPIQLKKNRSAFYNNMIEELTNYIKQKIKDENF